MPVTQEMLDSLPDEWKEKLDAMPSRHIMTAEESRQIETLILAYYPAKSLRQIAEVCGRSERAVYNRYVELKKQGKIT